MQLSMVTKQITFSEVTVRIFKDIVLSRVKANNVISLIDFACIIWKNITVTDLESLQTLETVGLSSDTI